jgi:zinc transport system substrate-binding protein
MIFTLSLVGCSTNEEIKTEGTDKVQVVVSFDAIKELVYVIGKEKVEISKIIPDGAQVHGFEPKAQDLKSLSTADLLVYNGAGMELWIDNAIEAVNNENLVIVDSSLNADLIEIEAVEEEHEDEDHDHGSFDPHLWLGLKGAQTQIKNIRDGLIKADPNNSEFYSQNYDEFYNQLEKLYQEYSEKFSKIENKTFVTGHAAFGYICRDFGLTQSSVRDVFAEGEPSAKQLAELVEYCKVNNVTTIFSEKLTSPAVSETLANEVGAKVEKIYTIAVNEDNKSYLERMTENLDKIYNSLK